MVVVFEKNELRIENKRESCNFYGVKRNKNVMLMKVYNYTTT